MSFRPFCPVLHFGVLISHFRTCRSSLPKRSQRGIPFLTPFRLSHCWNLFGGLQEERLLCPVRAIRTPLDLTLLPRHGSLFVSTQRPSHALSKNTLSFFIRRVILDAGAVAEGASLPRAHSVCGVAASAAFLCNLLVSKVLEAPTWRSNPVFTAFYFRDLTYFLDNCHSLVFLIRLVPW